MRWLLLFALLAVQPVFSQEKYPDQKLYTAAVFAADGKLWRLLPSQRHVAVAYSLDYGKTFSKAVRVNKKPQLINSWAENPPTIAVDAKGAVYVLYFADSKQPYASYFSRALDGEHFSKPVKISAKADTFVHYQAEMLVAPDGKVHFIWHDARDEADYSEHGGGDLSLIHLALDGDQVLSQRRLPQDRRIAKNICSCCRSGLALDKDGLPVVLARFVFPGGIRDLGMLKLAADGEASEPWRVTQDDWKLDGCPTHGPALSISATGRYHIAWFTQGKQRNGLFYAWSDDQGKSFSQPLAFGDGKALASNAEVFALGDKVALVWKEFDGKNTHIQAMNSKDGGITWDNPQKLAETASTAAYPALISDGKRIFMVWNSLETGFLLAAVQ